MKNFFKKLALVLALAMVVTVVAPAAASKSEAASVAISKKEAKVSIGKSYNFNVKNKVAGSKYAWSSSDESVATVKSNGVAKGLKVGEATISCKITLPNKKTTTVKGTLVVCPDATKVTINNEVAKLTVGQSHDFNRDIEPANTVNKTYWTVKLDGKVVADTKSGVGAAIMSDKGVFTPAVAGTYYITAQASRSKTATKMRGEADTVAVVVSMPRVTSVELVAKTYDDDTVGQKLELIVNGKATTLEELTAAGYTVYVNNATAILKGNITKNNVTLVDNPVKGEYPNVYVEVTKTGEYVKSAGVKLVVANLDALVSGLSADVYETTKVGKVNSQLVVGETVNLTGLKLTKNGKTTALTAAELATVKLTTSDAKVLGVAGQTVKAVAAGTATITASFGGQSISRTFTVNTAARKPVSVVAKVNSIVVADNATAADRLWFTVYDQYGETVDKDNTAYIVNAVSSDNNVLTVTEAGGDNGYYTINVTPATVADAKTVTVRFMAMKNTTVNQNDPDKDELFASMTATVKVTHNSNITNWVPYIKDVTGYSKDAALDLNNAADNKAIIAIAQYNNVNENLGDKDLTNATVKSSNTAVATVAIVDKNAVVTAQGVGSTDITVDGKTMNFTVVDSTLKLANIAYKNITLTYKGASVDIEDLLTLTKAGTNDMVLEGVTLTGSVDSKIRFNRAGEIYVDSNGDGKTFTDVRGVWENKVGFVGAPYVSASNNVTITNSNTYTATVTEATAGGTATIVYPVYRDAANGTQLIMNLYVQVNIAK